METYRLDSFTKGWFVGAFEPTIIAAKEVEVGIRHYRAGDCEAPHRHMVAVELTAVISGSVRMSGQIIRPGEIVRIAPGESTGFEALEDSITVVVKMPSVIGDKYLD